MTQYTANSPHQPKGDHNRRLSLGLESAAFALEAGISAEQLQSYERTAPDDDYDPEVADRVTITLDRLEQSLPNLQTGRDDTLGQPAIHPRHCRLSADELQPSTLEGAGIFDIRNRHIGTISHVHGTGSLAEVIVDVGGFFGLGAKPVAIPVAELDFRRNEAGETYAITRWSEDQLRALPEHRHL